MRKFVIGLVILFGFLDILAAVQVSGYANERFIAALRMHGAVRSVFDFYYDVLGPRTMVASLEAAFPYCHGEAHDLGKVVLEREKDLNSAIEICRYGCTGGCFHGVLMEQFGAKDGDHTTLEEVRDKIRVACDSQATVAYHKEGNCPHGVGHALASLAGYDLEKALSYCTLFPTRPLEYYCATGVFMEYDIKHNERDSVTKATLYPCDTFTEFPAGCFRYKMLHLKTSMSVEALQGICMEFQEYMRRGCFYGIGFAYTPDMYQRPESLATVCGAGELEDQKMCIEAISEEITEYNKEASTKACDSLSEGLREFCREGLERKYYSVAKDFSLYFKE